MTSRPKKSDDITDSKINKMKGGEKKGKVKLLRQASGEKMGEERYRTGWGAVDGVYSGRREIRVTIQSR